MRFEPNQDREVDLVPIGGSRLVRGLRLEYAGELDGRDHEPAPFGYGEKGEGHQDERIVH